jgi:hypothetical protein
VDIHSGATVYILPGVYILAYDFANDKRTGDPRVECMYCELQFVGHSTRIRAHLAGSSGVGVAACSAVPDEVMQEMIRVTQEL